MWVADLDFRNSPRNLEGAVDTARCQYVSGGIEYCRLRQRSTPGVDDFTSQIARCCLGFAGDFLGAARRGGKEYRECG